MTLPDTRDHYTRRAARPNYRNQLAVMSREHLLPFDVQPAAARLTVPAGTPGAVAHAVLFLMTNAFTTGAVLDVDGGER